MILVCAVSDGGEGQTLYSVRAMAELTGVLGRCSLPLCCCAWAPPPLPFVCCCSETRSGAAAKPLSEGMSKGSVSADSLWCGGVESGQSLVDKKSWESQSLGRRSSSWGRRSDSLPRAAAGTGTGTGTGTGPGAQAVLVINLAGCSLVGGGWTSARPPGGIVAVSLQTPMPSPPMRCWVESRSCLVNVFLSCLCLFFQKWSCLPYKTSSHASSPLPTKPSFASLLDQWRPTWAFSFVMAVYPPVPTWSSKSDGLAWRGARLAWAGSL